MMSQFYRVGAILFSTLIFLTGNGLLITLLPVRAHLESFSTLAIGLIGSSYNVGFVLGCFIAPHLLSRVGHIRTFSVGAGMAAAMALTQSILVDPTVWIVARAAYGFAAAAMFMVIESWLNDRADNRSRGQIFAAYMTVNFGGIMIGQLLFATSVPQSFVLFSIGAMACALCLIPVGLTTQPQPKRVPAPVLRPMRMFHISPVGVAGCVAVGLANGAVWAMAPIYAVDKGLSSGWTALFMTAFTLGGAAIQVPLGRLSDCMDRRYVIAAICALACAAGVTMAMVSFGGTWPLLGAFGLYGMLMLPLYGLSVAHANDRIPRDMFVESSATLLLINATASTLGPTLGAGAMAAFGAPALFWFAAAIHALMLLFTLARLKIKQAPDDTFRERFEPVPAQASPGALKLDPRGSEETGL